MNKPAPSTIDERFREKFNEVLHRMVNLEIIPDIQSRINERIPERGGFELYMSQDLEEFIHSEIQQVLDRVEKETIGEDEDFKDIEYNYAKQDIRSRLATLKEEILK